MRPVFRLFAFSAAWGGLAACAAISGLKDYSAGEGGTDPPLTKFNEAGSDSPASPTEAASDDTSGGEVPEGGDTDAGDGSAKLDGPPDAGDERGDASDGEASADADDGGSSPDAHDGCASVSHSNGVGQHYTDCEPLKTYGAGEAAKACAAADAGACGANTTLCFGGPTIECTQAAATCMCWSYTGATAGHVLTSKAGAICACPATSDPSWQ